MNPRIKAKIKATKYTNAARLNRIHSTRDLVRGSICTGRVKAMPVRINMINPRAISMLKSCHIRATSSGKEWICMVGFGVRFGRIVWQSLRFTRDYADLRSGFSFAGVAQW